MREPVVAHIFRQLMEALAFLHGRHLFHRDLKTENLLVSREDGRYTLKVADFGRTVFVPPQPSETGEGPTHLHEQFGYDNAIFPAEAVRGGCIGQGLADIARHVIARHSTQRERRFRVYKEAPGFRPGPRAIRLNTRGFIMRWMTCRAISVGLTCVG